MDELAHTFSGTHRRNAGSLSQSIDMLRSVVHGSTYETVAQAHGLTRTAVERRIKTVAVELTQVVGVDGLREEGATFVRRLRLHREAVLRALDDFAPRDASGARPARVLSAAEVNQGAARIRLRSSRPLHDLALYYLLFATGLRPLEVARLRVSDYLLADGSVVRQSRLRAEAAINGRERPLLFQSSRLDEALQAYLAERLARRQGLGESPAYRGLDGESALFLSSDGTPYRITPNGEPQQNRQVCRTLLEIFRKLFRLSGIKGLNTQSARLTLMSRMYDRGADEDQEGLVLGIADRSAVREQLPRPRPSLVEAVEEPI